MTAFDEHGRPVVLSVYDGDTLRLPDGRRVRFPGIDTPELGRPAADAAAARVAQLLEGRSVRLLPRDPPSDRYGRLLADVVAGGESVQAALVREGLAWCYGSAGPELLALQREAVAARRGVHGETGARRWVAGARVFHDPECRLARRGAASQPVTPDVAALFDLGLSPCRSCLLWPPQRRTAAFDGPRGG